MDDNVTRNVPRELENNDWNGMVMHYLGLDHIGHKSGPKRYGDAERCLPSLSDTLATALI